MIFKTKDSLESQIRALESALANASSPSQRRAAEKDLAIMRAGQKGEKEAAYYIDFELARNENWAVIHDLRLEWNGRVAQIDHLLIDRLLEIYVVESKSFRSKVRYAHGGWERLNYNDWEGIPSPTEQNERHIAVLRELIEQTRMSPIRLGLRMPPAFFNVVLVQPSCSIIGDHPTDARVFRADAFVRRIRAEDPSLASVFKVVSVETLHAFAAGLLEHHQPLQVPFQPATPPVTSLPITSPPAPHKCQSCYAPLSAAEVRFCRGNPDRFSDKLLCRKCQNWAPRNVPPAKPIGSLQFNDTPVPPANTVARCAECGTPVDAKIVAFCRINSKRMNRRTLCRKCQANV